MLFWIFLLEFLNLYIEEFNKALLSLSMSVDNSRNFIGTTRLSAVLNEDLLYNDLLKKHNKSDIMSYIDFFFSTPWQIFLSPNVEDWIFHQIANDLERIEDKTMLTKVFFKKLVFLYELLFVILLTIFNEFLFNNELLLQVYFNYFNKESIFSYGMNLNTNLDLYYNTLLELLSENNGHNYGLSYDIILNKSMYLWDSNRIKNNNYKNYSVNFNRNYLQDICDSNYNFLNRIISTKKIGYRTNITWENFIRGYKTRRWKKDSFFLWFRKDNILINNIIINNPLIKYLQNNFLNIGVTNSVFWPPISSKLLINYIPAVLTGNGFNSVKDLRFFGGYSPWYYYYNDNVPFAPIHRFMSNKREIYKWIIKYTPPRLTWGRYYDKNFWQRLGLEFVVPGQVPTGAWRKYITGITEWKWKFKWFKKYRFRYLPYTLNRLWDNVIWKNFRSYLWYDDVFMHNFVLRDLALNVKKELSKSFFEPYQNLSWYHNIPETRRWRVWHRVPIKHIDIGKFLGITRSFKWYNKPLGIQDDFYRLISPVSHYHYKAYWKPGVQTVSDYVDYKFFWKNNLDIVRSDFLIKRIVKKMPATVRDWDCYYQRRRWSTLEDAPSERLKIKKRKYFAERFGYKKRGLKSATERYVERFKIKSLYPRFLLRWEAFYATEKPFIYTIQPVYTGVRDSYLKNLRVGENPIYKDIRITKSKRIFDKSINDILILSKRAAKLIQESAFYSKKNQKLIQSSWIRNYVKNVIFGTDMPYFLEEKGMKNNIFFNKKYYTSIKSVSGDVLANIITKKYWTFNDRTAASTYVVNTFLNSNNNDSFFEKNFYPNFKHKSDFWKNKFYKNKQIFFFKNHFYEKYCDLNMLKYHYIFHKYNDISTYLNHVEQTGFLPVLDGKNFNEIFSWFNNKNKWVFYNFLKKHNTYMRLFQFHDLTKDNFAFNSKIQISNSFWSLQYFLQLLPFFGWSVLSNFLHKDSVGLDTSETSVFNIQHLHIFDFENIFNLKSWKYLENYYIPKIQEELEIVKKMDSGVRTFYNLFGNLNDARLAEGGWYRRGKSHSTVRKNFIFELGPYNWYRVYKDLTTDPRYKDNIYLLKFFDLIYYEETFLRSDNIKLDYRFYPFNTKLRKLEARFYPFNAKWGCERAAALINKGVIRVLNPIYPYDQKDVIFPNMHLVKSRWLLPHFSNIFCINDYIRTHRGYFWHFEPFYDDWIGYDYEDSMLDEYKKYTLGGLPACRHDDYDFVYAVYAKAFKRFFFWMYLSDFLDITSEKLLKTQYNIAYDSLWFDNHFAVEQTALNNVFYRENANVFLKKWWSNNKISFWYFLYPLLNKSFNMFIDYVNIIHLPKKQAYNLFYNYGYVTSTANEETKKYSLKQEYLPIFGNSFELEKAIYYKYFFIKDRKRYLFSFINETIMYINACFTIAITDYTNICNYLEKNIYFRIFAYFLITLIILLFYTFFSWIILNIIKTEFPLNNIYGVKVNIKRKDRLKFNKQEEKKKNWKEFITDDLKWILNEDITFGTESKFIYSLNDREKFWLKERVYNKHVAHLNSKVRTNYDIFYKKFSSDENFKFLETSWRIKINFDRIRDFWIIFKESLSWFIVGRLVIRLFNDRLFNFGRFIKQENPKLSFTLFEFIARLPKSIVLRPVFNFLKLVIGSVFIWFGIKIRHGLRAFRSDWYYLFFRNSLVLDQIKKEDMHAELDKFFKKLDASEVFNWYRENMDYFYKEVIKKDFSEANKEFFYLSKEPHWNFHMFIWNYYNNFRIKEDITEKQIKEAADKVNEHYNNDNNFTFEDLLPFKGKEQLEMEKKLRGKKGWENIFSLYRKKLDYYVDCDNSLKDYAILNKYSKKRFSRLDFNVEDAIKEKFRFQVKCIDYLIFNTLLTLIDDQNIQNVLKQKIKDLYSVNFEKQLDDIEWVIKALGSNTIYYNNKTSTKDYWLNLLGWRKDLLDEAYFQNILEDKLQNVKSSQEKDALLDAERYNIKLRRSKILNKEDERFTVFRFYNTIGSRFYYLLTLIMDVFIIWVDYVKKIRWNSKDLPTLAQIIILDIKKYWKKIFWQYVFLFNKEKIFKNVKIKIKDVFIFTVWVVSPLCLYFAFLIFIYIILYLLWSFFKFLSNRFRLNKLKFLLFYNKHFTSLFPFRLIYKLVKILLKSINFLITDIKTGDTIFDSLYNYLHYLLGKIQVFFFYIQGAYKVGKQEKNALTGIIYICKWIYLKLRVSFEKKILWITICNKIKMNNTTRIKDLFKAPINSGFLKFKLLFQLLKLDRDFLFIFLFVNEFIQGIIIFFAIYLLEHYDRYTILLLYQFLVLKAENFFKFYNDELIPFFYSSKEEKIKTLIKAFIKEPIKFLKKKSISWRITYYSKSWKDNISIFKLNSKIDNVIANNSLSFYFQLQRRLDRPWPLEIYVEQRALAHAAKIDTYDQTDFTKVLLGSHNIPWIDYEKYNWETFYQFCRRVKLKYWRESEILMRRIERDYKNYDKKVYLKQISPIKRIIKISYKLWQEHKYSPDKLFMAKEKARDRFFNKKWKERQKFVFRYFIKGLINWICYITFKKVIFTKIVELEEQLFVVRYKKYRQYRNLVPRLSSNLYFVSDLEKIPPQLWLLAILYEFYYHGVVFYIYDENCSYHHREYLTAPRNERVKRRIKTSYGKPSVYGLKVLLETEFNLKPSKFFDTTKKKATDLLSMYIYYALEKLSIEIIDTKNESWFDISSKYAEFYFVDPDIYEDGYYVDYGELPLEGKRISETDDKIRGRDGYVEYGEESDWVKALVSELTDLGLKKSALQLKLSFDSMAAEEGASTLPEKKDIHEAEKQAIFEIYGVPYGFEYGKRYWLDIEDRFETRWHYDKHLIQFNVMDGHYFAASTKISHIYYHITTIYYEITLKQLINQIEKVLSIKNKCIKFINVAPLPTLYYNVNYTNYPNFEEWAQSEKSAQQNLDDYTKSIYKDLKRKWTKKIKYARNEDIDWVLKIGEYEDIHSDIMQNATVGDFLFYFPSKTRSYLESRHQNYYLSKKKKEPYFAHKIIVNTLDVVSAWNTCISRRFISKDLFKSSFEQYLLDFFFLSPLREEKQWKKPLFFFNIAKFSWTQWVGFDLIEVERLKFKKKNTIIIHELYNIWNLKLEPLRVKLPIVLGLSNEELKKFFVHVKRFLKKLDVKNFYFPWNHFRTYTDHSITWSRFRSHLNELTDIKDEQVLLWLISGESNKFKGLALQYYNGIRALFLDMLRPSTSSIAINIHFSWDILFYFQIWEDYAEDFEYHEWFMMRANAYARADVEIIELQDDFIFLQYRIFYPVLFNYFFNTQRFKILSYKYIGIFCSLFIFYEIFYSPGAYLYNIWWVVVPFVVGIFSFINYFYLRKYLKEVLKGRDFYLYKYQSMSRRPLNKRIRGWWSYDQEAWEGIHKEFGYGGRELKWKTNTWNYTKNRFLTANTLRPYLQVMILAWFLQQFRELNMWRLDIFRGWDYYGRHRNSNDTTIRSFQEKVWMFYHDDRTEGGATIQNWWYMNIYRRKKNLPEVPLWGNYRDAEPMPTRRYTMRFRDPLTGDYHSLNLELSYYEVLFLPYSTQFKKIRDLLIIELRTKDGLMDWLTMLRYRAELLSNMYKYADQKNTKARLRRYIKRWRREQKEKLLDEILELGPTFDEVVTNTFMIVRKLVAQDNFRYANRYNVIVQKKREMFHSGEQLYYNMLLNLTKYEKHFTIYYYNLMKYKFQRNNYNNKSFFPQFDTIEKKTQYLMQQDFYYLKHNAARIIDINWVRHVVKMAKLKQYIKNFDLTTNKLQLIQKLWEKKINTAIDLFDKIIDFISLFYSWMNYKEILDILSIIIKFFF